MADITNQVSSDILTKSALRKARWKLFLKSFRKNWKLFVESKIGPIAIFTIQ